MEEIRNILLYINNLKKELEKNNIKNNNIKFNIKMIVENLDNLLEREEADLKYKLKQINKNNELLGMIINDK